MAGEQTPTPTSETPVAAPAAEAAPPNPEVKTEGTPEVTNRLGWLDMRGPLTLAPNAQRLSRRRYAMTRNAKPMAVGMGKKP